MTTGQKPGLRRFAATLLATAASAFAMGSAHAAYPDKPVRIVVGFSAGGTTDVIARIMAKELTESLGQSFVVENKPGAGSNIATDQVKRADPDGYTLLFVAVTSAINQTLYKNVNFDLTKDFTPVALGAKVPNILVVNPQVPVKSVQELVDYAKKNPGKLAFASSGSGTSIHMAGELFKMQAGIDVLHVPYKGSAPAKAAVMGGEVSITFEPAFTGLPQIQAGKLTALAVMSDKRSAVLPDLSTTAELGYPDMKMSAWVGILAPSGTPPAIVQTLSGTIEKIMAQPDVREALLRTGGEPVGYFGDAFSAYMRDESARYGRVIADAHIRID